MGDNGDGPLEGILSGMNGLEKHSHEPARKKVVVVGLGMVAISFIEKLMKLDAKEREYDIIVIGEEQHLAYNRVGLTSFFQHCRVEDLYLNPREWVDVFEGAAGGGVGWGAGDEEVDG